MEVVAKTLWIVCAWIVWWIARSLSMCHVVLHWKTSPSHPLRQIGNGLRCFHVSWNAWKLGITAALNCLGFTESGALTFVRRLWNKPVISTIQLWNCARLVWRVQTENQLERLCVSHLLLWNLFTDWTICFRSAVVKFMLHCQRLITHRPRFIMTNFQEPLV